MTSQRARRIHGSFCAPIPRSSAGLGQESDPFDDHIPLDSFDHIVQRQCGHSRCRQRLHFHTGSGCHRALRHDPDPGLDAFDPDRNPVWDCEPESLPTILGHPYPFEIVRDGADRIVMRYEVNNVERIVHLGMTEHPADVAPSPRGHSIGRIENGELVVETARFSPVRWGNGTGVDGSERKTTVERYRMSDDGKVLSLVFTMTDPEYLREPVTVEHTYDLTADYTLQDYTCDPATSRRHLTAGEE